MTIPEQIVDLCCQLQCTFIISSEWHQYPGGYTMRFVWQIESDVKGRSNSSGLHMTLHLCLIECLEWLKGLQ